MAQALQDHVEKRTGYRVTGDGWDGVAYVRFFTCSKGDVTTYRASGGELADGAVLPAKWGGVSTSTAYDPRLQECVDLQPKNKVTAELRTVWIKINTQ